METVTDMIIVIVIKTEIFINISHFNFIVNSIGKLNDAICLEMMGICIQVFSSPSLFNFVWRISGFCFYKKNTLIKVLQVD